MNVDEAEGDAFEYEDALLGFRFSKPRGWFVIPRPEALESVRSRILGCVSDDLQDDLNALLGRPAVMIAKHRHLEWGVNPNFQISPGPAGDDDPVDLLWDGLATWGDLVSGFAIEMDPIAVQLTDLPAARAVVRFLAENTAGEAAMCRVATYHVERPWLSYTLSCAAGLHEWTVELARDFYEMCYSLRLAPPQWMRN